MSAEEIDGGRAARTILDAYENCLQVRQQWVSMSDNDAGDEMMTLLHRQLNAAVKSYYEALYYHLKNEDAVDDLWEEETLWTERQPVTQDGQYVLDENNRPKVKEVEVSGLKQLEGSFNQTEVRQETISDAFGTRDVQREVNKKLPVKVLFDVARLLDEAADELGFLADVDSKSHRSEITDDLMEEVEKWRQANLE